MLVMKVSETKQKEEATSKVAKDEIQKLFVELKVLEPVESS